MVGNLKKQAGILVTIEEVVTLCKNHCTTDSGDFCYEAVTEWKQRYSQMNGLFSQIWMYSCLFEAGRIQGIREERRKHRSHHSPFLTGSDL